MVKEDSQTNLDMADKKTVDYKGKKAYIQKETDDFLFLSRRKNGKKQFVIRKDGQSIKG